MVVQVPSWARVIAACTWLAVSLLVERAWLRNLVNKLPRGLNSFIHYVAKLIKCNNLDGVKMADKQTDNQNKQLDVG